jgi:ribosomal protein S27E
MSESQAERMESLRAIVREMASGITNYTCQHCKVGFVVYGQASVKCDYCGKSPYPKRHASVKSEDNG